MLTTVTGQTDELTRTSAVIIISYYNLLMNNFYV